MTNAKIGQFSFPKAHVSVINSAVQLGKVATVSRTTEWLLMIKIIFVRFANESTDNSLTSD
jgi:hypothetical protein